MQASEDKHEALSKVTKLAIVRTTLASERTDFSLIRTGFTAASFGAGLTQIIGRGVWPAMAVDILTIVFVLAGALSAQIGLIRLQRRLPSLKNEFSAERFMQRILIFGLFILQVALCAIIIMVLVHM